MNLQGDALSSVQQQMSEENQELSKEDKEYIRTIYGDEMDCIHHAHKVLMFIEK